MSEPEVEYGGCIVCPKTSERRELLSSESITISDLYSVYFYARLDIWSVDVHTHQIGTSWR